MAVNNRGSEGPTSENLMLPADSRKFVIRNQRQIDNWALKQNRLFYKTCNNSGEKYIPILHYDVNQGGRGQMECKLDFLNDILKRNNLIAETLWSKQRGRLVYKPDKAVILGTGAESVFSSIPTMTLHPVYGIPYIPSSGLKGVVRNYYILKYYQASEKKALQDPKFQNIFGYSIGEDNAGAGKVVFLDSFPIKAPVLYYEAFTPHYKKYYEGKQLTKQLTDADSPIPLSFPAIKDTSFEILFGSAEPDAGIYIEELMKEIPEALSWIGIGGKTAIGYGLGTTRKLEL